jgi:hypothetical protein
MRPGTPLPAALATALAIGLAGCGIADPYTAKHPPTSPTRQPISTPATSMTQDPAPEQNGTIPAAAAGAQAQLAAGAAQPTPQAAIARYARLYLNWTAATVASVQQELASISLGQARAQALQAAAAYRADTTLAQSQVASTGTVISIAPSLTAPGTWVLVSAEHTTGQGDYAGLPAQLHITYAQTTHTPSGNVVDAWSPQD